MNAINISIPVPLLWVALILVTGDAGVIARPAAADALRYSADASPAPKPEGAYEMAVRGWKSAEEINGWIAAHFSYDMARALRLSETQRAAQHERMAIYSPSELFDAKTGVCVDLSRFGVETLRRIDPGCKAHYLMIAFEPVSLAGEVLRRHWLVCFERDGRKYFFADSKRPGHIAGPYSDTREFISAYEPFSGRKIVAYRELESYQKQPQGRALKLKALQKR